MQGKSFSDTTTIQKPAAGQTQEVNVLPGGNYVLGFSLDAATFDSHDGDVRVDFDDGAVISLHDFMRASEKEDFTLELPDGTRLSGKDVAEMFSLVLQDIQTDAADGDAPPAPFEADPAEGGAGEEDDFAALIESAGAGIAPLCHSVCEISLEHPLSDLPLTDNPPELAKEAQSPAAKDTPPPPAPQPPQSGNAQNAPEGDAPIAPVSTLTKSTGGVFLRIEDILDTSGPALAAPHTPSAGKSLFDLLQEGESTHSISAIPSPLDPSGSFFDGQLDGLDDPLLLAFFRLE